VQQRLLLDRHLALLSRQRQLRLHLGARRVLHVNVLVAILRAC
jgi:hypothetical protein